MYGGVNWNFKQNLFLFRLFFIASLLLVMILIDPPILFRHLLMSIVDSEIERKREEEMATWHTDQIVQNTHAIQISRTVFGNHARDYAQAHKSR